MFTIVGYDANRRLVLVFSYWSAGGEDLRTWTIVLELVVVIYGDHFNNRRTILFSDRDKGLLKALKKVCPLVNSIACHDHLKRSVNNAAGISMVPVFVGMALATTQPEFNTWWRKASQTLLNYLDGFGEKNVWAKLYHKECAHGRIASSVHSPLCDTSTNHML